MALLLLPALLLGCATFDRAERAIDDAQAATRAAEVQARGDPDPRQGQVRVDGTPYLGSRSVALQQGAPLPSRLEQDDGVSIATQRPSSLQEMAAKISAETGIAIAIGNLGPGDAEQLPLLPRLSYSGPLSALLNTIAPRYGVAWRYRDGQISFFSYETRTFVIYALASDSGVSSGINSSIAGATSGAQGQSAGSGGQGGASQGANLSSQSVDVKGQLKLWAELAAAVQSMLPKGSTLSASAAAGTVTVTAPVATMREVAQYIADQNRRLGRLIALDVQVVSLTVSETDQYALDLGLVVREAGGATLNLQGPAALAASGIGSLALGVINAAPNAANAKFNGSRAALRALSSHGRLATLYSNRLVTLNNRPTPLQIANSKTFLASVSNTATANVGSQVALIPGTVVTGFNLTATPRILSQGRLLLDFSLGISELRELATITSGTGATTSSIQAPDVDSSTELQAVALESGSTLMLTSYAKDRIQTDKSGIGSPNFSLLGGGRSADRQRTILITLVTPEVLRSPVEQPSLPPAAGALGGASQSAPAGEGIWGGVPPPPALAANPVARLAPAPKLAGGELD